MEAKLSPRLSLLMSSDLNYITRSRDKRTPVDFVGEVPLPHLYGCFDRVGLTGYKNGRD